MTSSPLAKQPSSPDDGMSSDLAMHLVDEIRCTSNLAWSTCQAIAARVVRTLSDARLEPAGLEELARVLETGDVLRVDACSDTRDLISAADRLGQMHADTQERSWALHEESDSVVEFLDDLNSLVGLADPRVPVSVFKAAAEGPPLSHLVELYQMEQRGPIRVALLRTLSTVSGLAPKFVDSLSTTTLPLDLSRDLLEADSRGAVAAQTVRKISLSGTAVAADQIAREKRLESLKLLANLFCTGTPVVYQNRDVIADPHLLRFCATQGVEGVKVLLAMNLQFVGDHASSPRGGGGNPVTKACLAGLPDNPELGQDIINFINRGTDPIWPYGAKNEQNEAKSGADRRPDPSIKLATDLLNDSTLGEPSGDDQESSSVFYNNDILVLFDVALREISNLPLSSRRTEFLTLLLALARFLTESQKEEILFLMGNMECRTEDMKIVENIVTACDMKS